MVCPRCGHEHPGNLQFCPETGQRIERCPHCDQPVDLHWSSCPSCSKSLKVAEIRPSDAAYQQPPRAERSQKSPIPLLMAELGLLLLLTSVVWFIFFRKPAAENAQPPVVIVVTATPFPTQTSAPTLAPLPTREPGTPLELAAAAANLAFSDGLLFYIYDPQPKTVSLANIEQTQFGFAYIPSADARDVRAVPALFYIDASGNQEFKEIFSDSVDTNVQMGESTFSLNFLLSHIQDQVAEEQGTERTHIIPVTIALTMLPIEQKGDLLVIGTAPISNVLQIPVRSE